MLYNNWNIIPYLLILLCFALRQAIKLKTFEFEKEEETIEYYIQNKSVIYRTDDNIIALFQNNQHKGLSIVPVLKICSPLNSKYEPQPIIATIGIDSTIKNRIKNDAREIFKIMFYFKDFDNIDQLNDYVKDKKYGKTGYDLVCFGMSFKEVAAHKYEYSLHYFDSVFQEGIRDIPDARKGLFAQFRSGLDLDSYVIPKKWIYLYNEINKWICVKKRNRRRKCNN